MTGTIRPYYADQWAPLNFAIGDGVEAIRYDGVKSWVPPDDQRRLSAYTYLAALMDNVARYWLPIVDADGNPIPHWILDRYREYGDPDLMVVTARAALLGDDQVISVDGAEETDDQGTPENARAAEVQDWLDAWADDEQLSLRLLEQETDTIGLGDAGFILGWDATVKRPRLETFDPGWYFPVLDPSKPSGGYPETVHLAWEEKYGQGKTRVRRKTWRLVDVIPRRLKYQDPTEQPAAKTCLYSEATWDMSKVRGDVFDLSEDSAEWAVGADGTELRDLDLLIDFLPVVHVPNTPSGKRHYGTALLTKIAQLLTDLAATDTDLQEASSTSGSSTLVTKGSGGGDLPAGPGQTYHLPTNGTAEWLDVSKNLLGLSEYRETQLKRLSVNARLPAEVLGRVDSAKAVAGIAMALAFGPLRSLNSEMRLVRREKHALLLKFAARMAVAGGMISPGPVPRSELVLGSFLPADQTGIVDQVSKLMSGPHPAISIETAVAMLVEAGLPIGDAQTEATRIKAQSFERAVQLLDAVGDEGPVRDFLGLPPAPTPTLPRPVPPNASPPPNAPPTVPPNG
jgi:hypothetical protein